MLSCKGDGLSASFCTPAFCKAQARGSLAGASCYLELWGSVGYLALSNVKMKAPKAITSHGVSIQAFNQGQKLQLEGDGAVPPVVCRPWDFPKTRSSYLRPFSPARGWQSPACCHQLS